MSSLPLCFCHFQLLTWKFRGPPGNLYITIYCGFFLHATLSMSLLFILINLFLHMINFLLLSLSWGISWCCIFNIRLFVPSQIGCLLIVWTFRVIQSSCYLYFFSCSSILFFSAQVIGFVNGIESKERRISYIYKLYNELYIWHFSLTENSYKTKSHKFVQRSGQLGKRNFKNSRTWWLLLKFEGGWESWSSLVNWFFNKVSEVKYCVWLYI